LCLRADGRTELRTLLSSLQLAFVFHPLREGITPLAESDAPVGDPARVITFQRGVEALDRVTELEGMQEGYCPVEFLLRCFVAGRREVYRSQLLSTAMFMLLGDATACHQKQNGSANDSHTQHDCPFLFLAGYCSRLA